MSRITSWCIRHAPLVISTCLLFAGLCAYYTVSEMRISSRLPDLIPGDLPYLLYEDDLIEHFPIYDPYTTLVVVEGQGAWNTEQAANALSLALRQEPELFKRVYYFGDSPFLHRNGLLHLDTETIQNLTDGLALAQPILSQLAEKPNLEGIGELLEKALQAHQDGESLPEELGRFMHRLASTIDAFLAGRPANDFWDTTFFSSSESHIRLILVHGFYEADAFLPSYRHTEHIRALAQELRLQEDYNVNVRLTGEPLLEQARLIGIQRLAAFAIALSAILVLGVLWIGSRSFMIALAIGLSLFTGISISMALALFLSTLELFFSFNHFTVAFAIMFIGIGADFFVHVTGRTLEQRDSAKPVLDGARKSVWAVFICFLTSAIGFFTFYPTEYQGLGQLGLISAVSLFIAFLLAFTLLPALLSQIPWHPRETPYTPALERFYTILSRHCRPVVILSLLIGFGAAFGAVRIPFDFSPLSVAEQDSEALLTLRHIQERGLVTQYTISILARDRQHAQQIAQRLEVLEEVRKVSTHDSLVPQDQEEKGYLLEEARLFLLPAMKISTQTQSANSVQALQDIHTTLTRLPPKTPVLATAAAHLAQAVQNLGNAPPQYATQFEHSLMSNFPPRLERLRLSLLAESFTLDDLPRDLRAQKESPEGKIWVVVHPTEDISDFNKLSAFVESILAREPKATGHPVGEYVVGDLVKRSLVQAFLMAFMAIALILLLALPQWRLIVSVLVPVTLTCLCAAATLMNLGIEFNHITVIVPPLVIGLGVDHGIHLAWRTREEGTVEKALASGIFRAILISSLTTLCSFFSLSFSSNPGIRDTGISLTVAMLYTLVFTFITTPALLAWQTQKKPLSQELS